MYRATGLVILLALGACEGEPSLREGLPPIDPGPAAPVDLSVTQTDVVVQTVNPRVDILYMVDNSCSMGNDQAALSENFPSFMQHFLGSGLEYQIGVVSSDVVNPQESGKLQGSFGDKWITPDMNNQVNRFSAAAVLGSSGAFPERGLDGIYRSKTDNAAADFNRGFFRDSAALNVICVSDELDYSKDVSLREFVSWFDGLKRTADERVFSAIESPNAIDYAGGGEFYSKVTAQIGGVKWNLDTDNWSDALDQLGLQATGLKSEYFLSRLPVEDTITVVVRTPIKGTDDFSELPQQQAELVEGQWVNGDWYYTPVRNSIVFAGEIPSELSRVDITYTVQSSVTE